MGVALRVPTAYDPRGLAGKRPDGFRSQRGAGSELQHDWAVAVRKREPRGLGWQPLAIAGLILVLAGLGCLIYLAVRAILGNGFDWMPWLLLGGSLIFIGAICNRVAWL